MCYKHLFSYQYLWVKLHDVWDLLQQKHGGGDSGQGYRETQVSMS